MILLDANVVIDYRESDKNILKLFSEGVEQLCISAGVLLKIRNFSEDDCGKLSIEVLVPAANEMANIKASGRLAMDDQECLAVTAERGLAVCSNDKLLRRRCSAKGIRVVWGLELMMILVERKLLDKARAKKIASSIRESNPSHITERIIRNFNKFINEL
jgi:rRNA-processing protein FCF1